MPRCQHCTFNAKNAGGLTSHVRACKQKKAAPPMNDTPDPVPGPTSTCENCDHLPVGSIELVSMLLILVFSLSAVLVTSVWALNNQASEISSLQAQVQTQAE